jgi:hypothetical protein
VATLAISAPVPLARPERQDGDGTALAALAAALKANVAAEQQSTLVTAYVPPSQDPATERALRELIERETTASIPDLPAYSAKPAPKTADPLTGLFDQTFGALASLLAPQTVPTGLVESALARTPAGALAARQVELIPPELDHIAESMVHPVPMSGTHWAILSEGEGWLDHTTELGPMTGQIGFVPESTPLTRYDRFANSSPILVASR